MNNITKDYIMKISQKLGKSKIRKKNRFNLL